MTSVSFVLCVPLWVQCDVGMGGKRVSGVFAVLGDTRCGTDAPYYVSRSVCSPVGLLRERYIVAKKRGISRQSLTDTALVVHCRENRPILATMYH